VSAITQFGSGEDLVNANAAVRNGAALLWRAPTELRLPVVAVLPDGTYTSVLINPKIRGIRRERVLAAARAGEGPSIGRTKPESEASAPTVAVHVFRCCGDGTDCLVRK
jgi:hypothetical protein